MVILAWFILNYTKLGRAAYAIGGNKEAAQAAGIDVKNCKVKIYALGFFVAVAALVQMGRIYSANALMGTARADQDCRSHHRWSQPGRGTGHDQWWQLWCTDHGCFGQRPEPHERFPFWQEFVIGCLIVLVVVVNMFSIRKLGN